MILARLRSIFTVEARPSEVFSGMATCLWGILAIRAAVQGVDWTGLSLMLQVADTWAWGALGIVSGLGQAFFFRPFDQKWRRPWLRRIASIVNAWLWLMVTYGIAREAALSPIIAASIGLASLNMFLSVSIFWTRR